MRMDTSPSYIYSTFANNTTFHNYTSNYVLLTDCRQQNIWETCSIIIIEILKDIKFLLPDFLDLKLEQKQIIT